MKQEDGDLQEEMSRQCTASLGLTVVIGGKKHARGPKFNSSGLQ